MIKDKNILIKLPFDSHKILKLEATEKDMPLRSYIKMILEKKVKEIKGIKKDDS